MSLTETNQPKRAEVINVEDENMLWDKTFLGMQLQSNFLVIWHFT